MGQRPSGTKETEQIFCNVWLSHVKTVGQYCIIPALNIRRYLDYLKLPGLLCIIHFLYYLVVAGRFAPDYNALRIPSAGH